MLTSIKLFALAIVAMVLAPLPVTAGMEWITLSVSTGGSVKALLGIPDGTVKAPGVVYSHGTAVRRLGYEAAKAQGYDIADYVKALNKAGYVAVAPVRREGVLANPFNRKKGAVHDESTPSIQAGIKQGIASLQSAVAFLKRHPTATGKVGAIGFSEGGLVTTWSAIKGLAVDAIVLISPATIRSARRLNMNKAAGSNDIVNIRAPVLITLGVDDKASILKGIKQRLIPALKAGGVTLESKSAYPGDHSWFWRVREEHFPDVVSFLDKNLE